MISVRQLSKQFTPFLTAAITAAGVIFGAIWAVSTELREEAATAAYSTYLEALILRASEEGNLKINHRERSLAAGKFLLYADDAVIKKVASLYLGVTRKDGRFVPPVLACPDPPIKKKVMKQFHMILLAMREDVGRPGNFSDDEYRAVFCNVWPK